MAQYGRTVSAAGVEPVACAILPLQRAIACLCLRIATNASGESNDVCVCKIRKTMMHSKRIHAGYHVSLFFCAILCYV
jgi:hypothetical protein